jgi:LmbE family N-acetylglucosaminyl deacetylase
LDKFGKEIVPDIYVDISSEIEDKEKMLRKHKSQQSWLLSHQDNKYIQSMKQFSEKRGRQINCKYAEGFRQHLGHGYPKKNLLKEILDKNVIEI